jgi:hypothetical protein
VSLIITDYWMPEMTGYELLKKVKVRATSILFFETWELQYRAHILSCIANGHLHAGVVQAEGDPCGHHVLRERAEHYQQVCLLPSGVGYACPNSEAIHVFFCILFFFASSHAWCSRSGAWRREQRISCSSLFARPTCRVCAAASFAEHGSTAI